MQSLDAKNNISSAIAREAVAGDRHALARLLTWVENDTLEGQEALSELYPLAGRSHLVGVTGSPGSGKSSLVNQLARHFRNPADGQPSRKVAVVAVDPSSPFSGGAVLGDRVRMRDLAGDPGVFIRSMASRGASGGLASNTDRVVRVLDAVGYEVIMIETVGAGQSEIEIADILVVNKADRPGVEATERSLLAMIEMNVDKWALRYAIDSDDPLEEDRLSAQWMPPVISTIAIQGTGIQELVAQIDAHYKFLQQNDKWERHQLGRLRAELENLVKDRLLVHWQNSLENGIFQQMLEAVSRRQISPEQAAQNLVAEFEAHSRSQKITNDSSSPE